MSLTGVAVSDGTGLTVGTDFQADTADGTHLIGDDCAAGTYGLPVGDVKLCLLCPAGTYSAAGTGCTSVTAGKESNAVGATTDGSDCAKGSYAQGGELAVLGSGC